jgi:hypothetical protein
MVPDTTNIKKTHYGFRQRGIRILRPKKLSQIDRPENLPIIVATSPRLPPNYINILLVFSYIVIVSSPYVQHQ